MGCLKLSYEYEREGLELSAVFLGEGLEKSATEQNFRTNYYPFGLHHSSSWTRVNDLKNNFLFNAGSELNEQTKNYETPFRQYDPALGRFTGIDALASSFSSWTPYQFAYNDPIAFNDPTGLQNQSGLMGDMYGELGNSPYGVRQADYGQGIRSRGPYAGYGVGSGYHWSDQYRSVEGNLDLMSTSTFRGFYGIDGMSDSELADFARGSGLGSTYRVQDESGWVARGWVIDRVDPDGWTTRHMHYDWVEKYALIEENTHSYQSTNTFNFLGYTANQAAVQGLYFGGGELVADVWYKARASKITSAQFSGTRSTAKALGNVADKAPLFATRLASGSNMIKAVNFMKVAGPAATVAGLGVSFYKVGTGQAGGWDYADIAVNSVGLGVTLLGSFATTAALVSNPAGWVIGAGVLIYNGYRIYQNFSEP